MKKLLYLLPFIAQFSLAQVVVTRDTNLTTDSSVGLDVKSDRQATALPEYKITAYNIYPYGKEPKGGSIVFSPNKDNNIEDFYGYFYWDEDQHIWVKLLDSASFSSDTDYSSPYFFTNYNGLTNQSVGVEVLSPFTGVNNNTNATLSSMTNTNHINGTNLTTMTNYWTMIPSGSDFQPVFQFQKTADAFIKVNAMLVKPGGGTFDFSVAMGVFINDVLVANKIFPFVNLSDLGLCARRKITILAPVNNIPANIPQNIKIGFRIIGNNHFTSSANTSLDNFTLNRAKISVGLAFSSTTGNQGTFCANSSFQSPVNVTVYGVTR